MFLRGCRFYLSNSAGGGHLIRAFEVTCTVSGNLQVVIRSFPPPLARAKQKTNKHGRRLYESMSSVCFVRACKAHKKLLEAFSCNELLTFMQRFGLASQYSNNNRRYTPPDLWPQVRKHSGLCSKNSPAEAVLTKCLADFNEVDLRVGLCIAFFSGTNHFLYVFR